MISSKYDFVASAGIDGSSLLEDFLWLDEYSCSRLGRDCIGLKGPENTWSGKCLLLDVLVCRIRTLGVIGVSHTHSFARFWAHQVRGLVNVSKLWKSTLGPESRANLEIEARGT